MTVHRSTRPGRHPRRVVRLPQARAGAALALAVIAGLLGLEGSLVAGEATREQLEFFEARIRPLLAECCYECHSASAKKIKGGLRLDSRAGVLKGGDDGAVITPGDAAKSPLLKLVKSSDADTRMPPKQPLTPAQIADLETWVTMGAPDPRSGALEASASEKLFAAAASHWAFRPVVQPPLPETTRDARNPIDAFIGAALTAQGLSPSARADSRTLVRRVYVDLVGLPPPLAEVEAFADACRGSPAAGQAALAALVDHVLASPAYGERWGRHWLDVARYADNMGAIFNNTTDYPHGFTYRDWVVRAFNQDMPYDRFVQEQLAADLLPQTAGDNRDLSALGFLTIGRRHDGQVDDNVFDDRIDVICRGLMGLTVACARCHDHKLEPVTSVDYYALYAVLRSSKEAEVYPELVPQPDSPARQGYLAARDLRLEAHATALMAGAEGALFALRAQVGAYLLAAHDAGLKKTYDSGTVKGDILAKRKLQEVVHNQLVGDYATWVVKQPAVFAPWIAFAALSAGDFAAQAGPLCARFAANADQALHPLVAAAFAGAPPVDLAGVAARYDALFGLPLAAWRLQAQGALVAARAVREEERALGTKELDRKLLERLLAVEQEVRLDDAPAEALRQLLTAEHSPFRIKPDELGNGNLFAETSKQELNRSATAITELDTLPGAPLRAMALHDDQIYDGKVFVRGDPAKQGAPAPRRFLSVLGGPDRPAFPAKASGRLELAQAITSPDNPLTARVLVNRVWQWHFGEGLVRTMSDFGLRGQPPSNPALLDWLAADLVAHGWSLKRLHRLIMLSDTYQQASAVAPPAAGAAARAGRDGAARARAPRSGMEIDPENRLLWRMNPRRLEFEAFRDAVLAVSGRLDPALGGRPVDLASGECARRTLYGFIDRKTLPNLYRSFDFPDPNFTAAQREHSALTPQALFLLNSPCIIGAARTLAAAADQGHGDPAAKVRSLYRQILARDPGAHELERALAYLARYPAHDVVMPEVSDWKYGFGEFDPASQRVTSFTALTRFTDQRLRGGTIGGADVSGLEITSDGGKPATAKALVRRWTAPCDGAVDIYAELVATKKGGGGVVCRLVSSSVGLLGEWSAASSDTLTLRNGVQVKRGDTLDFLTSSADQKADESFVWAPTITMPGLAMPGMPSMAMRWDARSNFMDPDKLPQPIGAWEELAQVLLLSNEFACAD